MFSARPYLFLSALIGVLALPALASLIYVKYTGDTTMRPLGITLANLTENSVTGTSAGITVQINWGKNTRSPNTKAQVELAINKSMSVYPVDFLVRLTETKGDRIQIYFLAGTNRLGPFSLQNVSSGIPAALAAYRTTTGKHP